jgi:hypothetical protein
MCACIMCVLIAQLLYVIFTLCDIFLDVMFLQPAVVVLM